MLMHAANLQSATSMQRVAECVDVNLRATVESIIINLCQKRRSINRFCDNLRVINSTSGVWMRIAYNHYVTRNLIQKCTFMYA
jgi:hypothetical protein